MAEQSPGNLGKGQSSTGQMAVDAVENASKAAEAISAEAGTTPIDLPDFASSMPDGAAATAAAMLAQSAAAGVGIGLLDDVTLRVKIELGRTQMYVEDVLRLNTNSVVELDKAAGDPVDIYVNDRHVARGEVLVLNENFCVRVSEIIQQVGADE